MLSEEDKCPNCAGKLEVRGNKKIAFIVIQNSIITWKRRE